MTVLLIGKAELAALATGTPCVVAAPGTKGIETLPVTVLVPRDGVLRRHDADFDPYAEAEEPGVKLPDGLRPLALLAADEAALAELPGDLPPGLPRILGDQPLPALAARLATVLAESELLRGEMRRRLAGLPPPRPRLVIDLEPQGQAAPTPRHTQPLGRPAEGICAISLHVANAILGPGSVLVARLLAGSRVVGAWRLPHTAIEPGWVVLELPEPAPPGPAEAVLELVPEIEGRDMLRFSTAEEAPDATSPLALRVEVAEAGHAAAPRHFDWAQRDLLAVPPGVALPISEAVLAAARIERAIARQVAAGEEPARLVLDIPAGAEALVELPPLPVGAAELALAECAGRLGSSPEVALRAAGVESEVPPRDSGWRSTDVEGGLRLALPLPPSPAGAVRLTLAVRNSGQVTATLEVSRLGLMGGTAGVTRRPPIATAAPAPRRGTLSAPPPRAAATSQGPRGSIALPTAQPASASAPSRPAVSSLPPAAAAFARAAAIGTGFRTSPPQPPLAAAGAGAPVQVALPDAPAPAAAPAAAPTPSATPATPPAQEIGGAWGGSAFRDLQLHQHMVNAEGTYRHVDVSITGLTTATGLWRQVRLKLFDRRGVIGLEFRDMRGWPQVFDNWPGSRTDNYGRFWRLETEGTEEALGQLGTPHDRALIEALLELLPLIATRAGRAATLSAVEQDEWAERARALASTVERLRRAA